MTQETKPKKKNDNEFTIMIFAVFLLLMVMLVVHFGLRFFH